MQLTQDEHREIYRALDAEVEKLGRAYLKAAKAHSAAYSAPWYEPAGTMQSELLAQKRTQARKAYRAAFDHSAQYFDTYIKD